MCNFLKIHGLIINRSKYIFGELPINLLGHPVDQYGASLSPDKVKSHFGFPATQDSERHAAVFF